MAKRSYFDKLEDIPEFDRPDYKLVGGRYVLDLDGAHPTQIKNSELLAEKAVRETEKAAAVTAATAVKDAEISRLTGELATARTSPVLPAGQIAVKAEDFAQLNEFRGLGELKDVKTKVEEHGTLKAATEAQTRKTLLADAAKTHGFDADAFTLLAEPKGLADKLDAREIDDGKGGKIKHFFVKGKDAAGADTAVVLSDYVKANDEFKPFLASLQVKDEKGIPIPRQGTGEPPSEKSAAQAYLARTYKRPGEKKEAA